MEHAKEKRGILRRKRAGHKVRGGTTDPWYKKYVVPAIIVVLTSVTGALVTAYFTGALTGNTMRATFSTKPKFEANVTLRQFYERLHNSPPAYPEDQLNAPGYMAHARIDIEGFKGKTCTIQGYLMDAETRSKIDLPIPWKDSPGSGIGWQAERLTDAVTVFVWLPDLKLQKPFYIAMEAYAPNKTLLATEETDVIKPPQPSPSPASTTQEKP